MAELTPMMKQYLEIKKDNPDSILFFRLGDFYEMFADDAKLASRELDLFFGFWLLRSMLLLGLWLRL